MQIAVSKGTENRATQINTFLGLNRLRRPDMGEAEAMENMSSDEFPCASPKKGRELVAEATGKILAVAAPDAAFTQSISGFTGISGDGFYYNGERKTTITGTRKSNKLSIALDENAKWEIKKKGDIYIMNGYNPDTKRSGFYYYNTETDEFGYGGKVMPKMIVMIGNDDKGSYIEALRYCAAVDDYVINYADGDTFDCGDYRKLYYYGAGAISEKENIFAHYFEAGDELRIEGFKSTNEGQFFEVDDGVYKTADFITDFSRFNTVDADDIPYSQTIAGIAHVYVEGFSSVSSSSDRHKMYIKAYSNSNKEVDFPTFYSDLNPFYYAGVTISKKMPNISTFGLHQGRIWGAPPSGRYIYASASDDIFSFSTADMANAFAWRMPSDTSGAFTAFVSFNGELLGMKRESITVISGTSVKNYYTHTIHGTGCIAPRSVATTPHGVMFLSYRGFYIYNGTLPESFSHKLNTEYSDATSGYDGRKYYASATDTDGNREVLVYDTHNGLWHRETGDTVTGYFNFCDGFYMCDENYLYRLGTTSEDVTWSITPEMMGGIDLWGVNEVWVRAEISDGAEFSVSSDRGDNNWCNHATFTQRDSVGVYRASVRFSHGNNYRLRISGRGSVIIYGIELIHSTGGRRIKERMI